MNIEFGFLLKSSTSMANAASKVNIVIASIDSFT